MFYNDWPCSDMYTLNLDWILRKLKEIPGMIDSAVSSVVIPSSDIYPTFASAVSANLPVGSIFRIANWREGDGNYGTFRVVRGFRGMVYAMDGRRADFIGGVVYPENFGAIGDGVNDDTAVLKICAMYPVVAFKSTSRYRVHAPITVDHDFTLYANGGTIVRDMTIPVHTLDFVGCDVRIYGLNIRDGENVVDDKTAMVVTCDNCGYVLFSACDFRTTSCKTNWYLTISGKDVNLENCHIDSHFGATEWGDACHIVKADNVHIANCNFIGADDALAFVPQGNVGLTDGAIQNISVLNCYMSSPLYSGVKIGRYKASDLYAEPDTVVFGNCVFNDCDRWVTMMQRYETYNRTDVIFNSCIFRGNHSRNQQFPVNTETADEHHGGGYHVSFIGCTMQDEDPNNTKGIFNVSALKYLEVFGNYIRVQASEMIGSGRSEPAIVDITVNGNTVEHAGTNCRMINNGAINGDVTVMNNKITVTGSTFGNGYFYSFSADVNWYDIVNNLFSSQLVGTMSGPNYTTGGNIVRGTHG